MSTKETCQSIDLPGCNGLERRQRFATAYMCMKSYMVLKGEKQYLIIVLLGLITMYHVINGLDGRKNTEMYVYEWHYGFERRHI